MTRSRLGCLTAEPEHFTFPLLARPVFCFWGSLASLNGQGNAGYCMDFAGALPLRETCG